MALKDRRYTKFKVGWHRDPTSDGTPRWYAEMGGVRVAEAVNTSSTGTDDYPWEWSLTDSGEGLCVGKGRRYGVSDTLRAVKVRIDELLRPRNA